MSSLKTALICAALVGMSSIAHAVGPLDQVPEIDPTQLVASLAVLAGLVLIFRERRRHDP